MLQTNGQPITSNPGWDRARWVGSDRHQRCRHESTLKRPPRLTHEAWLDIWHQDHTQVAIETQDDFLYVQNVVVHPLTHGAPIIDAVVEECFPASAMTDPHAFFDAVGDEDKLKRNSGSMMDSCNRFIDFDKLDVVPHQPIRHQDTGRLTEHTSEFSPPQQCGDGGPLLSRACTPRRTLHQGCT
ncbi:hypothetical protein CNE_BB1p06950 (plasmid) [Cupriavidus necator N-1]|uniref:EthD domain-containing protein n=1 Tax=Cupriavidus necator (strain ATCC 43291 / DSM 13513 / CCUG 52238 / LMG 8453 / N-1) TaxID=1042878 RepID=F8GXP5_CUPNN|nr:hypothetical protein CNE_BB1p06950 [Cupriavidus necator N-1]